MEATKNTTSNKIQKSKIQNSPKGKANRGKAGKPHGRESNGHKSVNMKLPHRRRNQENGSTEHYGPVYKTFSSQLHDLLLGKSNDTLLNKMGHAIDRGQELKTRLDQEIPGVKNTGEGFFDKVDFMVSEFTSMRGKSKLELMTKFEIMQRKLTEIQEEREKLKDCNEELRHHIKNLETCNDQENRSHRNAITFYLAENKKLKDEIENLNASNGLLEREKSKLKEECSTSPISLQMLYKENIQLTSKNNKLNNELQAMATYRNEVRSKHIELMLENKKLNQENEMLKERLENHPEFSDLNGGKDDCGKCASCRNEYNFVRDCGRQLSPNTECSEISFANSSISED